MSFSNYEDYYQHCVKYYRDDKFDEYNINYYDYTKNQLLDVSDEDHLTHYEYLSYTNKINNLNSYIDTNPYNLVDISALSYKTLCNISYNDNLCHILEKIINNLIMRSFKNDITYGCDMELHRIYMYQNIPIGNGKSDDLNCNQYHWKNEPKTIITFYIYLNDVTENDSHISVLRHPVNKKCITMPTNRTGIDNWGPNTHSRYKDCRLSDAQVEEFKYYGFEERKLIGKAGKCFALSSNVIHKHNLKTANNMLVLKFRPTDNNKSIKSMIEKCGGIFDLPVDPSPY